MPQVEPLRGLRFERKFVVSGGTGLSCNRLEPLGAGFNLRASEKTRLSPLIFAMKQRSVQRGVQTPNDLRKPGSGPTLGKVAKMPGYGRRGTRRRRNHDDDYLMQRQQQRGTRVAVWFIGIGLVTVVALCASFKFWVYPLLQGENRPTESLRVAAEAKVKVASKFKSPSREEALALVKKAIGLRKAEEVEQVIRSGSASALEVVGFLEAMQAEDGDITKYIWMRSVDKNGLLLEGVLVNFGKADNVKRRIAFLTPDAKGVWKLDFEAFARRVEPSWKALLEEGAESGVVRVYAAKDTYFNGPFREEQNWVAYKLVTPDTEDVLVGYCKAGSAQNRAMEMLWQHGEVAMARVTLEIHHPEKSAGAERTQFEISRVLAEDWVLAEKPFEEGL